PNPDENPRQGQIIYRVWGNDSGPFGSSWSPVDPRLSGAATFRIVAGLPDRMNTGDFLTIAVLDDPIGVIPRGSLPVSPSDDYGNPKYTGIGVAYCTYPGGAPEYLIQGAAGKVTPIEELPLVPRYGGRPPPCRDGSEPRP